MTDKCGNMCFHTYVEMTYVKINTAELCGYIEYTVDICYGALI